MLCSFKLFYHGSSIRQMKQVLRPQFTLSEASNTGNRCKPMIKKKQKPKHR